MLNEKIKTLQLQLEQFREKNGGVGPAMPEDSDAGATIPPSADGVTQSSVGVDTSMFRNLVIPGTRMKRYCFKKQRSGEDDSLHGRLDEQFWDEHGFDDSDGELEFDFAGGEDLGCWGPPPLTAFPGQFARRRKNDSFELVFSTTSARRKSCAGLCTKD